MKISMNKKQLKKKTYKYRNVYPILRFRETHFVKSCSVITHAERNVEILRDIWRAKSKLLLKGKLCKTLWYAFKINDVQRHYNLCVQGCWFYCLPKYLPRSFIYMIKNKRLIITAMIFKQIIFEKRYRQIFFNFFLLVIKQKCQGQSSVFCLINFCITIKTILTFPLTIFFKIFYSKLKFCFCEYFRLEVFSIFFSN